MYKILSPFVWRLHIEFGKVVSEEKSIENVDGQWTTEATIL